MTIIKQLVFFTIMSIYVFADTCSYDLGSCRHDINFQYFNDNLLSYYLTSFNKHTQSEIEIFSFQIVSSGQDCSTILEIEYELNFFSPEVNFENFEKFYNGILNFSTKEGVQYFIKHTNMFKHSGNIKSTILTMCAPIPKGGRTIIHGGGKLDPRGCDSSQFNNITVDVTYKRFL